MYNARRMMEEARIQLLKHNNVEAKKKDPPLKPMMRTVMRKAELLTLYAQGCKLRDTRAQEEQNFEAGHDLAMEALRDLKVSHFKKAGVTDTQLAFRGMA